MPNISAGDLERQLARLFETIESACEMAHASNAEFYTKSARAGHNCALSLVTGLAEGSDQAGASAIPGHWMLEVLLAMPRAAFRRHLESQGTGDPQRRANALVQFDALLERANTRVTELPSPTGAFGEPSPFARLRDMLLRNSDVVVTIWDEDAGGAGQGGTADVLNLARRANLPVVVLPLRNQTLAAPYVLDRIGPDAKPIAYAMANGFDALLVSILTDLLSPPADTSHARKRRPHDSQRSARERMKDFLTENRTGIRFTGHFRWFKGFFDRSVAREKLKEISSDHPSYQGLQEEARKRPSLWQKFQTPESPYGWSDFLAASPADGEPDSLNRRLAEILLPRFGWCDALAIHYADAYRSSYLVTYFLSALAVAIAVASLFIPHGWPGDWQLNLKAVLVLLELIILGGIWRLVVHGDRGSWHGRWLDYRALAETLRHVRALALVGAHSRFPVGLEPMSSNNTWIVWYARATVREIGLPGTQLSTDYLRHCVAAVKTYEVDAQIAYNADSEVALHRMYHFLHKTGDRSFLLATIVLALFLVGYGVHLAESTFARPSVVTVSKAATATFERHGLALSSGSGSTSGPQDTARETVAHDDTVETGSAMGNVLITLKLLVAALAALLPAIGASLAGIGAMGDFEGFANRTGATRRSLELLRDKRYESLQTPSLEETEQVFLDTTEILASDLGIWRSLYGQKPLTLPA